MSTHQYPMVDGDLFGQFYLFDRRGEGLPMHKHPRELEHNVIVLRGWVQVYGPEKKWLNELGPTSVFVFPDPGQLHEIAALADDTLILNLYRHGMPENYKGLSLSALADEFSRPLTIPLKEGAADAAPRLSSPPL